MIKLTLFIVVMSSVLVTANELPSCNIEKSSAMVFSNEIEMDTLSVKIKGTPCHKAELELKIINKTGDLVYKYKAPFKPYIAVQWDDPKLNVDADKLAESIFEGYHFGSTDKLPLWMPKPDYYDANYQELKVSKEYYLSLTSKSWSTFSHKDHYEGWKIITYNRDKHEAVLISAGGL
jgi:hypothetical protein